jgi:hypothetical protein
MSQLSMAIVDKLTGSENYSIWKFQVSIMFHARKMMGIVNNTQRRETYGDEDKWNNRDAAC